MIDRELIQDMTDTVLKYVRQELSERATRGFTRQWKGEIEWWFDVKDLEVE